VELIRTLVLTKLIFVSFLVHHFCSELVSDCTSIYDFQQTVGNEMFLDNQPCSKNGRGTIAQGSIEVDARAEGSTRETEEKLDGRSKEGHEREEPARRAVGR
jgi:hypothetical protein